MAQWQIDPYHRLTSVPTRTPAAVFRSSSRSGRLRSRLTVMMQLLSVTHLLRVLHPTRVAFVVTVAPSGTLHTTSEPAPWEGANLQSVARNTLHHITEDVQLVERGLQTGTDAPPRVFSARGNQREALAKSVHCIYGRLVSRAGSLSATVSFHTHGWQYEGSTGPATDTAHRHCW